MSHGPRLWQRQVVCPWSGIVCFLINIIVCFVLGAIIICVTTTAGLLLLCMMQYYWYYYCCIQLYYYSTQKYRARQANLVSWLRNICWCLRLAETPPENKLSSSSSLPIIIIYAKTKKAQKTNYLMWRMNEWIMSYSNNGRNEGQDHYTLYVVFSSFQATVYDLIFNNKNNKNTQANLQTHNAHTQEK